VVGHYFFLAIGAHHFINALDEFMGLAFVTRKFGNFGLFDFKGKALGHHWCLEQFGHPVDPFGRWPGLVC
jgi:hypothetical protein